jgi:hypothetical protein
MPPSPSDAHRSTLDKLLVDNGLTAASRLYREAVREALTPTGTPGVFLLAANASPSETVVDVYGAGYVVQAEQLGAGLAFAETARPNWQDTMELRTLRHLRAAADGTGVDKVEVEVTLGDVLEQGGLVYAVESVTVERVWYCTLPAGTIQVREVA